MASPSPKKSLSVRLDNESKPSIHAKVGENSYKSVANFFFSIKHFIVFPDNLSRYSYYYYLMLFIHGDLSTKE
jgi:hypothetical protein